MAVATPEASDVADRLDLSVSSIDMTNTALAMHEEKDCDISGIGKLKTRYSSTAASCRFSVKVKALKTRFGSSCHTEELEDSPPPSLSANSQADQPELSSLAAMDLTSALSLADNPDVSAAEPFDLLAEPAEAAISLAESHDDQFADVASLPSESDDAPPEDLLQASPIDLLPSLQADEAMLDRSLTQAMEDVAAPVEEPANESPSHHHHHCSHDNHQEEAAE